MNVLLCPGEGGGISIKWKRATYKRDLIFTNDLPNFMYINVINTLI